MNKQTLISALNKYVDFEEKNLLFKEIEVQNLSFIKLREIIYSIGDLLEEDEANHIFVCAVKSGYFNLNTAYAVIQLSDNKVSFAIYAREGLINQNTSKKVLDLFIEKINKVGKKSKGSPKKYFFILFLIIVFALGILFIPKYLSLDDAILYTKQYNSAIKEYNQSVETYNAIAKESCLDNIDGYLSEYDKLSTQSTNSKEVWNSLFQGNSVDTIKEDISTLKEMKNSIDTKSEIADQLINPKEEWVISKLENCTDIAHIQSVTESNDPNKLLNKDGGYTSTVYFTVKQITDDDEYTDSIKLGTDGGGCIEVYKNINDAKSRCTYLESFNNSILATGSYSLIGTMVVRTSYQLDEESQYNLTDEIFNSLTTLK